MYVTLSGIVMSFSDSHPQKAQSSMLVTPSGITMLANDPHQ